ncbi:hypothetical protein ACFPYJ_32290 [Paenibacillus solisilvae]|uniref:Uncharacterized protein n=1 Tax=Paenibacillus solisilvae TaxID=2486751 RepID=A0ABW0W9R5_9BACL
MTRQFAQRSLAVALALGLIFLTGCGSNGNGGGYHFPGGIETNSEGFV